LNADVVIVGAGPAGLFAARELVVHGFSGSILIIDEGPDVEERKCPERFTKICARCKPCLMVSGVGGAGIFSSGLLNLHPQIGGDLGEWLDPEQQWRIVEYVDSAFVEFGAPTRLYVPDPIKSAELSRKAAAVGMRFIPIKQRHIGTENSIRVIANFRDFLKNRGVHFLLKTRVESFNKGFVVLKDGKRIECRYVILAPGRSGADWLARECKRLGIQTRFEPIDVGVRVEVPSVILDPVVEVSVDPKFHIYTKTYRDFVRTFCVNHRGFVVREVYNNYVGVNGHTFESVKSENSNFAFLVRVALTEPVENTLAYGDAIAKQAATIGGGKPILQTLGDLRRGRRSTWGRIRMGLVRPTLTDVTPGDIGMALPHRIVIDIIEGLESLDNVIPGVASDSTLLYAPEIKFSALRVEVDKYMEPSIENIFVAGDGAGLSRGIVVAAATGVLAARGILRKEGLIN